MTTPAPELRKLYLRVIRRVHPDGAIDEQDRLRCERLTQQANRAYAVGDEAALRAVLEPKPPRSGWYLRRSAGRRFLLRWNALKIKPWQVAGRGHRFRPCMLLHHHYGEASKDHRHDAVASCGSAATGRYQIAHDEHSCPAHPGWGTVATVCIRI
jgi:hypothetical protein